MNVAAADSSDLDGILERLAARGEQHDLLSYRLVCNATVSLEVLTSETSPKTHEHQLTLTRERGLPPKVAREKMNTKGNMVASRPGKLYDALTQFVPVAQASLFTRETQAVLNFRLLGADELSAIGGSLPCRLDGQVMVEFVDREGPVKGRRGCTASPSGRICVDSTSGELGRVEFYPVVERDDRCTWDLGRRTAVIEQNFRAPTTGLRFPDWLQITRPGKGKPGLEQLTQTLNDCIFEEID